MSGTNTVRTNTPSPKSSSTFFYLNPALEAEFKKMEAEVEKQVAQVRARVVAEAAKMESKLFS